MKLDNKSDLDYFVEEIIKNGTDNKEEIFLILRDRIYELYLKQGDIPPTWYINLYFVFKDIRFEKHEKIEEFIITIKNYYKNASIEEILLMNNILFILEVLNGFPAEALKNYVKRGLVIPYLAFMNNTETKRFVSFITENSLDSEVLIKAVKETVKNFFSFNDTEQRSIFVNALSIIWNSPSMFNNTIWLEIFYDLTELLDELIKEELIEKQMYVHFFTYHVYGNNIHTIEQWRVFNKKVEKPASLFYKKWGEKNELVSCKEKVTGKKIGFLVDRMVLNSPNMYLYSLVKFLKQNSDYEVYVYSMSYIDKNVDENWFINKFFEIGANFYSNADKFKSYGYYYPHLEKALDLREKIIDDGIDYLISGFGYDIPNFIFSNRSAPKQIFWSHGNCTSEVENIDVRFSHFEQKCKEYNWYVIDIPLAEEFMVGSEHEKEQGLLLKNSLKHTFGENTVFLGTIGRLIKIDSEEYLKAVAEIMEQNPNTVYLACGIGNKETILEKLKKFKIDDKRFVFTGQINPHVFGWIIDVWLDSFPLLQGHSRNEFMAKGSGVVVFAPDKSFREDRWYKDEVYEKEEFELLFPKNREDYIKSVNKVLKEGLYKKLGDKMKKDMEYLFKPKKTFLDLLKEIEK